MTSCHRSTVIYGLLILVLISIFLPKTDAVLSVTTSPSFVARYPTQSVTFTCTISDNLYSVTAVRWYFSNTLILTNGVPISSYSGRASGGTVSSPSLILTNLVMSDAGSYICSATNSNGENRNSSHSTLGMQNGATPSNVQIANVVGNTISLITGDSIMLNCSASGSPIPNITFWRNGVKIWDGSPYTITNIQSNQAGQYMCVASNYFGQSNSTVQLDVYVKPSSVILSASSTNVNVNQPVTFSCFANGVPSQSYRWYKGNSLIAGQTGSNYQIASAQGTDSGSYQCQAYNLAGSTTSSTVTLTVNTAVAPTSATITSSPSNGQVNEGSTITLTCTSDGTNPSYSWTRNGASTTWNTQSITITNAGSQDTDTYVCQASNAVGSVVRSFSVMVIISPKSVTISPSSSATYSLGNTITLTCSAAGSSPTYTWTHGSRTFQGAVVSIQSAQRTDSGTYVCQASNAAGSSTSSVTVTVYYAPQVVSISPTSLAINSGDQIQLSCSADGLPTPTYKWFKGLTTWDVQTLTIASSRGSDSGIYACQASNSEGSKNATVTVSVAATGPGTITFSQTSPLNVLKGNQVFITCSASGTPTPTFSWSKGGTTVFNGATLSLSNVDKTDSGVYTCTGTNTEGTNSEQFTVNVQYAPEMSTTTNSISATDGETISMTCNNDANPVATTFEWNCQGSITNTTKTLSVSVSGTDDFSCSCKAFNSIGGSVSQTFSVTVSATGGTGNIGAATGGGLTTGEIAAICLAVLFIVLLIIIIIVCCCLYGVCAGVCGKKEKHKVEPKKEKEEEVIHKVEIPRFHEKPKQRVPSAVTRKDVDLTVNQDNMMYEEEEFEINTKYAIVPPGSHRSVNGTIISMQDQRAPKDHRLPALDLTYDEEERRRKRRRRKKKKHRSHREPAEGMETPHEPRESSRSRRSHRSHRSSHRYSGELMDDDNYHSRYEDGDLVVIPGPDSYDH